MQLAHLTWHQAEPILRRPETIVAIPVGSTEQHGPIGPLGTDWLIPEWITKEMEKHVDLLVAPVMPFGVATHHTSFPGTIDLGLEPMTNVMRGIFESLARHGARRFLIVNGHGGNDPAIERVGLEVARKTGALSLLLDWWTIAPQLNPAWPTGHGDAQEVSAIRYINPSLIAAETCPETRTVPLSDDFAFTHLSSLRFKDAQIKLIRDIRRGISEGGFGGLPSEVSSEEWGRDMMTAVVNYFCEVAEAFRKVPIDRPEDLTF